MLKKTRGFQHFRSNKKELIALFLAPPSLRFCAGSSAAHLLEHTADIQTTNSSAFLPPLHFCILLKKAAQLEVILFSLVKKLLRLCQHQGVMTVH